ncbi:MAG: Bax inhibitor-1/YccA family protein [Terracidiphilus sp.]
MALMKTSNPVLNGKVFENSPIARYGGAIEETSRMTLTGTVNKTGILLLCAIASAAWTWSQFTQSQDPAAVAPMMIGGLIGGLVVALITMFKKEWSAVTAPIYAFFEGMVLGGISVFMEARFPGIAIQAVSLTFGTLLVLLLAYRSGLIPVTAKLRMGIIAATGGICLFYFLEILLGFFGIQFASINGSGIIGIGFSLFVVAIAALNLVLDFDFIEMGVQVGAPKYMEWYGAFGIIVTLVWLYLEILILLSKLRRR